MRGNNVMGSLFSNMHEESIRELTDRRTMASVPIGGRYRMIDFTLSSMVNSGINRVGGNYQTELSIPDGSPGNRKGVGSFQKTRRFVHSAALWSGRRGFF